MNDMDHTEQRGAHIDGAAEADTFLRLAGEIHAAVAVEETVDAVVQFALQALDCSYAGVAVHTNGDRPEIPAVTDPVVAEIYQFQLDSHDGPLIASMRDRATVLICNAGADQRWPQWAAKVATLGVRSVLDVPLTL